MSRYLPRLTALSTRSGLPLPSLILSFAILHELTAIIPLGALFFAFQAGDVGSTVVNWANNLQSSGETDPGIWQWKIRVGSWMDEGQKRVDRVARRYGFFGYEKGTKVEDRDESRDDPAALFIAAKQSQAAAGVANAVAAYIVVKSILPLRIAASAGLSVPFTRYLLNPLQRTVQRRFSKPQSKATPS